MSITLPVSIGEALDKLTILDIKLEKISDERKKDVKKEYDILYDSLKSYITQFSYHYNHLKQSNLAIWETQEKCHGVSGDPSLFTPLYKDILLENDRRFRIKKKINNIMSSNLKEQKGYHLKKVFFYGHLGLGDMFWMNGAVRYLSTLYDIVYIVCKKRNEKNVRMMYRDDPDIILYVIEDDYQVQPFSSVSQMIKTKYNCDILSCGFHVLNKQPRIYDFPNCFYDDINFDRSIRKDYFYIQPTEEGYNLLKEIKQLNVPYIVLHQESSGNKINISDKFMLTDMLILDLNKNLYPSTHKYYNVANLVVNKPLIDYIQLFENAEELHMIESSGYCLATHCNLSNVKVKTCYNPFGGSPENCGVFNSYNKISKVAFITGVYGQDGQYLLQLLKEKEYKTYGLTRKSTTHRDINYDFKPDVELIGDITDGESIKKCLEKILDDYDVLEIYNLAAQSSVYDSFEKPSGMDNNGVLSILDYIKKSPNKNKIKYYQASSSEIYGITEESPQIETTPFTPRTPYGVTKLTSYWLTRIYRECYNIFSVNGILYNHESRFRQDKFVSKKIINGIKDIVNGTQEYIELGNINASRDWGYAKDYVLGMWKMLQYEKPDDWILATGELHTVREFVEKSFLSFGIKIVWEGEGVNEVGKNGEKIVVKINPMFYRPIDYNNLVGDYVKANKLLDWEPKVKFNEIIDILISGKD